MGLLRAIFDLLVTMMLLSKVKLFNKLGLLFLNNEQKHTFNTYKNLDALFVKADFFIVTEV